MSLNLLEHHGKWATVGASAPLIDMKCSKDLDLTTQFKRTCLQKGSPAHQFLIVYEPVNPQEQNPNFLHVKHHLTFTTLTNMINHLSSMI